jgi:long-chain fatty acid transport protein
MAGASTAAPLDAAGAGYWNPAAISGLPQNEVYFGADLIYANTHVTAEPFPPPGANFSDTGLAAAPAIALVYHQEDSPITLGLGTYTLVGGAVNFPTPQSSLPLTTLSNQFSSAFDLVLTPTASVQVTDRLAIGGGLTIDVMTMSLDPAFFAGEPPTKPGEGFFFPAATHGRPFWGGGFRIGAYYELNPCWSFGFSYLSPQWFETFQWHSLDRTGTPRTIALGLRLPSVLSWGAAYRGFERTVVALDIRYFDYAGSEPFGLAVSEGGTDWKSIFAAALGVERQLGDRFKLRAGYLFSENPVPEVLTLFNTQLPGINQHQLSMGVAVQLSKAISMDFAWVHGFKNSIRGPVAPEQLPGATVQLDQSFDALVFGTAVKF